MLAKAVAKARSRRRDLIQKVQREVETGLRGRRHEGAHRRAARRRCTPSTSKMDEKHLSFAQVTDIYGFRVIVPTVTDCYTALGMLHQMYKPVPGTLQGPHRDPQGQRLPVAAHHAGRALGRERRVPDAHRGHARGGRVRRGGALAVQGQPTPTGDDRRAAGHQVAAVAAGHPARDARRRRVLGPRQDRPVPRRGLRLHAQEPDHGAAARRHRGRLRLRDPQQRRRPHRGRAASTARRCRCAPS